MSQEHITASKTRALFFLFILFPTEKTSLSRRNGSSGFAKTLIRGNTVKGSQRRDNWGSRPIREEGRGGGYRLGGGSHAEASGAGAQGGGPCAEDRAREEAPREEVLAL